MIKVKEKNGKQYIYQYDTGREVIITPEGGYTVDSIEYFNNTTDLAPIGIIREVDGVLLSEIPNSFLQSANTIQVYLVTHDAENRQTIEYKDITVIPRAKPTDYVLKPDAVLAWHSLDERLKILEEGGTDGGMNKEQLQEAVNTALTQAKESGEFDGADGEDGQDGITPHIGNNGNWFIGAIDTGKPSRGEKGDAGEQGPKGDKGDTGADGKTPVKGTDYFTEEDKTELVASVLNELPNGNSKEPVVLCDFTLEEDITNYGSIIIPLNDDPFNYSTLLISITSQQADDSGQYMGAICGNGKRAAVMHLNTIFNKTSLTRVGVLVNLFKDTFYAIAAKKVDYMWNSTSQYACYGVIEEYTETNNNTFQITNSSALSGATIKVEAM